MLKIVQKSRKLPDFRTIFNILAKWFSALKLCLHTKIISTTIFIQILLLVKNDRDWNIAIFTRTNIFLLWLGEITHMKDLVKLYCLSTGACQSNILEPGFGSTMWRQNLYSHYEYSQTELSSTYPCTSSSSPQVIPLVGARDECLEVWDCPLQDS